MIIQAFKLVIYFFLFCFSWVVLTFIAWWLPFLITSILMSIACVKLIISKFSPRDCSEDKVTEFEVDLTKPRWQVKYVGIVLQVFARRLIFMILFLALGMTAIQSMTTTIVKTRNTIIEFTTPLMESYEEQKKNVPSIYDLMDPKDKEFQKLKTVFDDGLQVRR